MATPSVRRSRMRAGDRRQAILRAALGVFSRKGYGGATTKEIAAAAGVTEAIIFRHFSNKHELYGAVLDLRTETPGIQAWLTEMRGYMDRKDDAGLFQAMVASVLKSHRNDLEYERLLLFAALEGHEYALAHHRRLSLGIFQYVNEYLTRRQQEGALRGYSPGLMVTMLVGAAQFYATRTQMFGFEFGGKSDEAVAEAMTQMLLEGIQPAAAGKKSSKSA